MKKIISFIIVLSTLHLLAFSQGQVDTSKQKQQSTKTTSDTGIQKKAAPPSVTTNKTDSGKTADTTGPNSASNRSDVQPISKNGDWLLIFSPLIVFILIYGSSLLFGLKKFNFTDAMTESEYAKTTIVNPVLTHLLETRPDIDIDKIKDLPLTIEISQIPPAQASNEANANEIKKDSPPIALPSMSRYIAFLTSILTLIIALCMSCFYIYYYIRTGSQPDLSPLSIILIALGLGITPYALNKISGAIASNKTD